MMTMKYTLPIDANRFFGIQMGHSKSRVIKLVINTGNLVQGENSDFLPVP